MTTTTDDPRSTTPELDIPSETVKPLLAWPVVDPGTVVSGWVVGGGEGELVGANEGAVVLLGSAEVGAILGLTRSAMSKLVERGRQGVPVPTADYVIGDPEDEDANVVLGWLPDRKEELLAWYADPVAWQESEHVEGALVRLLGHAGIAALFGVDEATVRAWRIAHTRSRRTTPAPEPDFVIGKGRPVSGWLPEREQDWRDWRAGRVGRGRKHGERPLGTI